jgi:hypothetical protein
LASFNVEKLFVSKIIQEQDMSEVIDIPSYFLDDADYRSAYEFIRTYYSEIGSVPTQRVFMADFQTAAGSPLKLVEVDEPWEDLRKRLNLQYIKGVLLKMIVLTMPLTFSEPLLPRFTRLSRTAVT